MVQWDFYSLTELEREITDAYLQFNIKNPHHLKENQIAEKFDIKLIYADVPSHSFEKGSFRCIVIDNKLPPEKQREDFFHELGHLKRGHGGDQTRMSDLFRSLQEGQADHFLMYAAMPYFMIKEIQMPEYERDVARILSHEFGVTLELAKKRWDQIKRRMSTGRWEHACIEHERNRYRKADPANWCPEAKRMFRTAIQRKMEKGQGVVLR